MNKLPYTATTATGDVFDVEFDLHADTESPVRIAQLVDALLGTLDREIAVLGTTSNGDVLQALAMATALRARMIHAPPAVTAGISTELLADALEATAAVERKAPPSGRG